MTMSKYLNVAIFLAWVLLCLLLCLLVPTGADGQNSLCAQVPSPCVTVTGTLAGSNGLRAANLTLTFNPSQAFLTQGNTANCSSGDVNYDIPFAEAGLPPANTTIPVQTFTRQVTLPVNFAGSTGTVAANPTAPATFTLYDTPGTSTNGTCLSSGSPVLMGTATISTLGEFTFFSSGFTQLNICDTYSVHTPTIQDATLSGVSFTLSGTASQ